MLFSNFIKGKNIKDYLNADTYFASDLHLGHKNILSFEQSRLTAMTIDGHVNHEEWIIENWNSTISENDNVFLLGDFAFKAVHTYANALKGNIFLVLGNHDRKPCSAAYENFVVVDGVYTEKNGIIYKDISSLPDDDLLSGLFVHSDVGKLGITHYALFHSDDWDLKNKFIQPRIEVLQKAYEEIDASKNIHGHLHSMHSDFKDSINASLEHIDFRPKQLKDLLEL
jgi:calcineurin-like phosphoesterase family protein